MIPARFTTIDEIVKGLLLREEDFTGRKRLLYKSIAKDIYKELNLDTIRAPLRRIVYVDKRKNSIQVPEDCYAVSSISIYNECGDIVPLIVNENIATDTPDIALAYDCGCECGCKNEMCSHVKSYELIQEDVSVVMPDTTVKVFVGTYRKKINRDGSYVTEKIWPTQQLEDGEYVGVVMESTEEFLCKLEMEDCGCVKNCAENECKLNECSNANSYQIDCGCPVCPQPDMLTYNMSSEGDRIAFDDSFCYDSVLLRYYSAQKTKDILVPIIARRVIMFAIKAEGDNFDKKVPVGKVAKWEADLAKALIVLKSALNKINLKSFYRNYLGRRKMV